MQSLFKSSILICFLTFLTLIALASNKVGNGGNIVRCKEQKKTTSVLLDFYEASLTPKSDAQYAVTAAELALRKLKASAPKLADQYIQRLSQIQSEIDYKNEVQLVDVQDSKHLFKPLAKECEILQVAVRSTTIPASGKRFVIRKDLWDQLEPVQQAGLLTHEIIYEHLSKLGEQDSIKARRINAWIYKNDPKTEDFWKLIKELELPIYP